MASKPKDDVATEVDTSQYDNNVKANYKPEGFADQDEFLKDMREEYELDLEYDRLNRESAMDDKKFAAGEQWDPIVLENRKGLPCLVINSVPQFTAQLVGDWRENKKGIKVVPSEDGDTDIADVRADLIRAIEMKSRATRVYNSAFESMIQCGDGAYRISVEYARNSAFDQDIFIRPIEDALSCVWDRMSVDPTGRDARHVWVDDYMSKKEFNRKWPDSDPSILGSNIRNELWAGGWVDEQGVRITEYWRLIERDRLLALFQDGSTRFVDAGTMEALVAKHGAPQKLRMSPCTYAQMHLVTGFKILSGPYEYQLDRVPIIRMSGRVVNVANRRIRYGLVRFMKDAVRLKNFWRSVAAEQLGYAPKAQWIGPESAFEGREETFRKAHLSRDPILIYNDDASAPPERVDPPAPQAALLNEAQVNAQDMKDITGIHDASLGIKSNETSGKAINARQREGDIASLTYYDNGNASVLEGGDVVNQLISQIYDGTRVIRIIGEDEAVKYAKVNDPDDPMSPDLSVGQYDVALDSGASYSTRRVEAAAAMMDAVQVWPQMLQVAGDLVAKAQDWPGADKLAERLKKTIPPQFLEDGDPDKPKDAPTPTPEEIQGVMQHLEELTEENKQLKAKTAIDAQKLVIDAYNAETQRIRALSDNQVDGNSLELNAISEILSHSIKLDGQNKQHELAKETAVAKSKDSGTPAPKSKPSQ